MSIAHCLLFFHRSENEGMLELMNNISTIVLTFLLFTSVAFAEDTVQLKHCKDHPNVIAPCFRFRGRLEAWNGTPTYRITRFGTKRILGVSDGMALPNYWQVPENIAVHLTTFDSAVIADYEFCPFTKDKPGVMRLGCIESATNIKAYIRDN